MIILDFIVHMKLKICNVNLNLSNYTRLLKIIDR